MKILSNVGAVYSARIIHTARDQFPDSSEVLVGCPSGVAGAITGDIAQLFNKNGYPVRWEWEPGWFRVVSSARCGRQDLLLLPWGDDRIIMRPWGDFLEEGLLLEGWKLP